MFHFYTPSKHEKTSGFLMFSVGIEIENWLKMGEKWVKRINEKDLRDSPQDALIASEATTRGVL